MDAGNINQLWADLLVEELARCGVRHFLVTPGSRSAPLAVAAARNKRIDTLVHYDERGASFAALGCGKTGHTAAVICTSGTAVANCLPAVCEAHQSATPLLILSADRPPELQGCGANQTMNQAGLFGHHVLEQETIPCPNIYMAPENLLTKIDTLTAAAGSVGRGGPVHINCMYREPLDPINIPSSWPDSYLSMLNTWEDADTPYTKRNSSSLMLSVQQLQFLKEYIRNAQQGLLLIGNLSTKEEEKAAAKLAKYLQWPLFADITSNCRCTNSNDTSINCYDTLLRSGQFRSFCKPDIILHIGDTFVSKRLQEYLVTIQSEYIQLSSRGDNRDPAHRVTQHFQVDIAAACCQLIESGGEAPKPSRLLKKIQQVNQTVNKQMEQHIAKAKHFTELSVAAAVNDVCTQEHVLFIGNSMPIRDLDTTVSVCNAARIYANRGVSGIDGNIAAAAGVAWASGFPTIALIGDMTALHDLNSLALLKKIKTPLILLIVNNKGGGIFSFLPIAQQEDVMDSYFTNAHTLEFEKAAALFEVPYYCAEDNKALKEHLKAAVRCGKPAIVEAIVDRNENVKAHNELARALTDHSEEYMRR